MDPPLVVPTDVPVCPLEQSSRPPLLEKLGIRFVVVPHLAHTKLDGAAAYVKEGPIVALTMRYDRIDYFWFTLFHELAHLVLDHQGGHLDETHDDDEISDEKQAANQQAGTWLVSEADLRALCRPEPRSMPSRPSTPSIQASSSGASTG